jgi:hypothetical protein
MRKSIVDERQYKKEWLNEGCFNPARKYIWLSAPPFNAAPFGRQIDDIALTRRRRCFVCFCETVSHSHSLYCLLFRRIIKRQHMSETRIPSSNHHLELARTSFQALLNGDIEHRIPVKLTGRTCRIERDFFVANIEVADDKTIDSNIVTAAVGHGRHEALRDADILVPVTAAKFFDPNIRDGDIAEVL